MSDRYTRTLPWSANEYITVDGIPRVYVHDAHGLLVVKMHGGGSASLIALEEHGHRVEMPRRMRKGECDVEQVETPS